MSLSCASEKAPLGVLREIVRRYGTPTYAFNIASIRAQVAKLRTHLPAEGEILYSLKANASLGLCGVLAECGLGADVASAGEMATALAAGFLPACIFVTGPDRSPALLAHLQSMPDVVISVDSVSDPVLGFDLAWAVRLSAATDENDYDERRRLRAGFSRIW